jgi:hypothetical protein
MIDALFNDPNYLAGKKVLDAIALRQDAIASNIANLETPGYHRVDLAPSFKTELERACASGDPQQIASLKPALAPDPNPVIDRAITLHEPLNRFLRQEIREGFRGAQSWSLLGQTLSVPASPASTQSSPPK